MSLYHEAASFLTTSPDGNGSLASRIYGAKDLKSKPTHVYALVSEATKWSAILSEVVERADVLRLEKKLTPRLALLLTHDLLLANAGIAAPKEHGLRLAIERHKARLSAEFTKARLKAGQPTVDAWRAVISRKPSGELLNGSTAGRESSRLTHPRWVRINTLRTSLDVELNSLFKDYNHDYSLHEVTKASDERILAKDKHIPNLVALPRGVDLSKSPSYRQGKIIFQDKASCFSAYLLDPKPEDGNIIDACAAPGNKTTHLAALLAEFRGYRRVDAHHPPQHIFACERDKPRAITLQKMVRLAGAAVPDVGAKSSGAGGSVECLPGQDFLRLKHQDPRWRNVGALLLDPSCSGSGIVGRGEEDTEPIPAATLPRTAAQLELQRDDSKGARGKKRKRTAPTAVAPSKAPMPDANNNLGPASEDQVEPDPEAALAARLTSLSAFQLKILTHSFGFPGARKVVYSTCSVHVEENERVVLRALASTVATERGWRLLKRTEQVRGMREWGVRGDVEAVERLVRDDGECSLDSGGEGGRRRRSVGEVKEIAEACLRCRKGTDEGTMGFFVVGFVRNGGVGIAERDERPVEEELLSPVEEEIGGDDDEFNGFSDDEAN